jgi:uncharacterized membrane protein YedE/YeeE
MAWIVFVTFGGLFGYALSRGRVTDYDTIAGMFRLTDLHLFGVIGSAIATAALGLWLVRRGGNVTVLGAPVEIRRKPWQAGTVWGGLMFGAGWALTGACPGTALVQVGEGKVVALITVAGILTGTYVYGLVRSKGETTMKKAFATAGMVALTLVFATPVLAQHGGAAGTPATPPGPAQMDPSMCASMMTAMQHGGPHQSGMQHAGMRPGAMEGSGPGAGTMGPGMMMGMMASTDPATMQMRGEIMKAMGEIMMKYGKAMEKPAR